MQAVILAAGMGKRLGNLTSDNTKCMVKVNGVTLIERVLKQLDELNLSRVVIVVGYKGQKLKDFISTLEIKTQIIYVENPIYNRTNNIYSLSLASDYLKEDDTILLESDLIFDLQILKDLLDDSRETLAVVDKYESWMDGTVVTLNENEEIQDFIPGKYFSFLEKDSYYKTVNIYKFSQNFSKQYYLPFLNAYSEAMGNNEYYEQVLKILSVLSSSPISGKKVDGKRWYEIDDIQDLEIASSLFSEESQKPEKITSDFGGFWRYPKLMDFCYLVNPYFPPKRMIEELKSNFEVLISNYPSGIRRNSLLGAKMFGLKENYVVVGNGASEIIHSLLKNFDQKLGLVRPSFDEYFNRATKAERTIYTPNNNQFSYTAEDVINFFDKNPVNMLVIVNPDNPTGNYIKQANILKIAQWAQKKGTKFIVDESFVDFAEEKNSSLLEDKILEAYPNMSVIKSISKSYGVPGLRLGVFASADEDLISNLRQSAMIWNINSFAENFLQIESKYDNMYINSLEIYKRVRNDFLKGLEKISFLRVIPSQANFVMCELLQGVKFEKLAEYLLKNYKIIIKGLKKKIDGEYIRISVRTDIENTKLIEALKNFIESAGYE